ncbi:uncharacterized protein [Physcomitrium patens]|uniref:ubiquitinyl hydrolase 1 n=1 Tax=Physcomitrium patens TaxID=3218 RepID=A0A2K1KIQ1_PHYPA|nr:ubiquitin carboxyl-terminal hydrolase MINDY-3-like [Physcomitrium patens]XP_024376406.1 ubiquitin carboxyl-terminal hydrolase MINDY-3-like [Physcomitrium patens]PNR53666.1 hypothetical protein PHYPA_007341 [Physcomitrium patens]|eukprot:XP_024376405.1 ubiquitin carboxyl-terminal hydrolase MINDY-3-like [Physcomitrella patens]
MGDHDDEELQRAFRMSLQPAPDAKRSKSWDVAGSTESPEAMDRRIQRELRAAAAEQRRVSAVGILDPSSSVSVDSTVASPFTKLRTPTKLTDREEGLASLRDDAEKANVNRGKRRVEEERQQLPLRLAEQLYMLVFGANVSKDVLCQWCHQGFRFSPDPETSLGLVQKEGGPCGVLAPIQALVLKYLLFATEDEKDIGMKSKPTLRSSPLKPLQTGHSDAANVKLIFSDTQRTWALVQAMGETLWHAGGKRKAVVAVLDIPEMYGEYGSNEHQLDKAIAKALEALCLGSGKDLHRLIRVSTVTSISTLHQQLRSSLPGFRSPWGALLLLFSLLLSRGLDLVYSDRDDPAQPMVTSPFGHASQEIVNLLLCGQAVPNVFDNNMDLGGVSIKGISTNCEVGFLTLLESLNLCQVGRNLKYPKWPIWVIGSESHYSILFALDPSVQDETDTEDHEVRVRQAFDAHDQSGGGGFISPEALQQILIDLNIQMPQDVLNNLFSSDIVTWNELWQALMQIDKSKGGLKDSGTVLNKRQFEVFHFNGIAKTVASSGDVTQQRPRLTRVRVSVPPKWTPDIALVEEYKAMEQSEVAQGSAAVVPEPAQHAPLVDCIRTRWQRATCNWTGDSPSIV